AQIRRIFLDAYGVLVVRKHKPELRPTKDFEAKYNKVKAKLALLSSSASASKASTVKNKGLIAEAYEWDEEEVSSDDNEMVEVKVLMALAEENDVVSKEGAKNGEWVKISMRKVHTLLEMEDNDDRKTYLDYLCIDLNYVEEQRNNLLSKHRDLVHELNACKEQLLVLKQAKLDFLTMQHVNTEILKENKNLRAELKELVAITETWLNSSNKVNQCISEQIPSQKKRILGVDQLTKDLSSSGQKDLVFVKSSADDTKVSIPGVERPWLSEAEGFILPNHDTGMILPAESQRNTIDPSVGVTDSSATDYDSVDESSVCSTPLPPLKKLDGTEPISGPKTIKSILRSKSTFKAKTLKGVIINEPSSALAKDNKSSLALKVNSASAGKLKSMKIKDDPPLAIFDEKRGTIFNSNKEVVMIAPRVRDVYVPDMTSSAQESCFFAKASENLNWLWHKRLAHSNFKTINKLAK
ncbi:retrovirus-related pol polyprotein from transposon TNT 1-94, partial [Tanacetum coccineum]